MSLLRARHDLHEADRAAYPGRWPTVEYDGESLDLVFTTADGTPTLRQHVDRAIRKAAERADIDSSSRSPGTAEVLDGRVRYAIDISGLSFRSVSPSGETTDEEKLDRMAVEGFQDPVGIEGCGALVSHRAWRGCGWS